MFKTIQAEELDQNIFKMIGKDWLLITAKKEDKVNTMTASWGSAGIMWGKPTAFVFIRPQRYTKATHTEKFLITAEQFLAVTRIK